ncbi:MAG: hypothetical protein VX834_09645, partial [Myxococcota bacterium]|nr:hypothetical protein [Myxococcota bacterium]
GNHRVVPLRNPSFHIQSVLAEIRGTYNVALEFSEFIGQPSPEGTSANNHPNLDAAGSPSEFGLSSPSAIAWREGYLWVADRDNHRVLRFSTDESSTESPARATAVLGQADAFHSYPNRVDGRSILGVSDLAIVPAQGPSSSEALWIVDREGHRVLIHDDIGAASDGQAAQDVRGQIGLLDYLPNRGTEASGQSLNSPSCMSVSQNSQRVAICDSGNHRIALMASTDSSRAGAWIVGPLLDPLTSDERLPLHAVSVAFIESAPGAAEPYLHAFVAAGDEQDPRAHRILVYDLSQTIFDEETPTMLDSPSRVIGQPFAEWETTPGYPANFCNQGNAQPSADTLCDLGALTADADGNLWVADAGNHRVLRFQAPSMGSSGIPLDSEGLLEALSADYVLGQVSFDENQSWDGREITAATSLSSPRGLAVELLTGSLWIAEPETGRVLRFAAPFVSGDSPSLDASLGRPRAPGTRLDAADVISPIAVSSSRAGDVVVIADAATNRVMRYTFNQAPTLTVGDGQYSYQVEEGTLGEAVRLTFSDPEGDGLIFDAEAIRAGLPGAISLNESDGSWQLRVDATELVAGQQVYAHLWLYDTSARANRSEALIAFKIIAPSRPEQTGAPDSSQPPAPERIAPPVTKNGCQGTESPLLSALLLGLFLIHSRRRVFG